MTRTPIKGDGGNLVGMVPVKPGWLAATGPSHHTHPSIVRPPAESIR